MGREDGDAAPALRRQPRRRTHLRLRVAGTRTGAAAVARGRRAGGRRRLPPQLRQPPLEDRLAQPQPVLLVLGPGLRVRAPRAAELLVLPVVGVARTTHVLDGLLGQLPAPEQPRQQPVVEHVLDLEEDVGLVRHPLAVAAKQVVVGEAAHRLVAGPPHAEVDDHAAGDRAAPVGVGLVGQADAGLDEVGPLVAQDAEAGGQVVGQEVVVAVEEEEGVALGQSGAGVAGGGGAGRGRPADGPPALAAGQEIGNDARGVVGGAVVHDDDLGADAGGRAVFGVEGGQGDRLDALARQVGEQAAAEVAEVPGGAPLGEEAAEAAQEVDERRSQLGNLLLRHPTPSGARRE
jgi:hypothetical protein